MTHPSKPRMTSAVWHAGLGFIKPIKIPIKMPGPLSGDGA